LQHLVTQGILGQPESVIIESSNEEERMVEKTSSKKGKTTPSQSHPTPEHVPAGPANGLAIAALVVGIVAVISGWVPFWGLIAGGAAIVLGILGLKKANGKGMAIAGLVTGAIGAFWSIFTTLITVVAIVAGFGVTNGVQQIVDEQHQEAQALIDSKKDFAKGETANFGDEFEVTVNSVETNYTPGEYYAPDEGNQFIVVNVTIENIADESEYLSSYLFSVIDNGIAVDASYAPVDDELSTGHLEPGASTTGNLVYEVGADATDLKLAYVVNTYDSSYDSRKLTYTLAF
jgi:hypothetical protein